MMPHISVSSVVVAASLITLTQAETIQLTLPTNPPQTLSETETRTFTNDLPPLSNDIPSQTTVTTCPTVVSLTSVCGDCVTIACIAPLTVTAPCGCPNQPVTILSAHPCGIGCAGLEGCQTETTVVTPTNCPSGSASGSGSGGPSSTGSGGGGGLSAEPTTTGASETGVSSSETSESQTSTETAVIVTTSITDTPSAPVSTLPPTSRSSTAAAARLTPFRFW